ncbi:hypothetical protein M2480_001150 [Parabacteroides sp. PFB2-12]|uniref:DUF4249 domain-containing protein n=1 Tax=unclassified Parabacteroides TaxID=2649774 RepID=UPI0024750E2B|nr:MULTISPECIES: DUF4249 domain-containing protein [unclassified Parabacteroides]MDH6342528.1 hypothetical protein [Parabacteroides sp. PM6-13]MDH6390180.1 hypothetical protein [Parabacteroides sp. PFB2-12]
MKLLFKNILTIALLAMLLEGCIEPYEPKNIIPTSGLLVVEGMLLEDAPTVVKLSRTIPLDQKNYQPVTADVAIVNTQGKSISLSASNVTGTYTLDTDFTFEEGEQYALDIRIGSEHYQSAFVTPVYTPEIDSLSYEYSKEDVEVKINVTTHDPANKQHYYRWSFEEDWEVRSTYRATARWDPIEKKLITDMDLSSSNNRYYCWSKDVSKTFILGNSERLSDAVIKDKTLHTIKGRGYRFSSLYSILVKQYGIPFDAYNYYRNLQRNIDETGSIFAPQPTEMAGNISCITNPDTPVIGFFAASVETRKRLYISENEVYLPPILDCEVPEDVYFVSFEDAYKKGYGLDLYMPPIDITYARLRCVDCIEAGGTKNRPDFWPNNHY